MTDIETPFVDPQPTEFEDVYNVLLPVFEGYTKDYAYHQYPSLEAVMEAVSATREELMSAHTWKHEKGAAEMYTNDWFYKTPMERFVTVKCSTLLSGGQFRVASFDMVTGTWLHDEKVLEMGCPHWDTKEEAEAFARERKVAEEQIPSDANFDERYGPNSPTSVLFKKWNYSERFDQWYSADRVVGQLQHEIMCKENLEKSNAASFWSFIPSWFWAW